MRGDVKTVNPNRHRPYVDFAVFSTNLFPPREEGTPKEKTLCGHLHTRPLACLPQPTGAMLGKLGHFKAKQGEADWDRVAGEAARTVPGRENGGNCDIKNLSRGCAVVRTRETPNTRA